MIADEKKIGVKYLFENYNLRRPRQNRRVTVGKCPFLAQTFKKNIIPNFLIASHKTTIFAIAPLITGDPAFIFRSATAL